MYHQDAAELVCIVWSLVSMVVELTSHKSTLDNRARKLSSPYSNGITCSKSLPSKFQLRHEPHVSPMSHPEGSAATGSGSRSGVAMVQVASVMSTKQHINQQSEPHQFSEGAVAEPSALNCWLYWLSDCRPSSAGVPGASKQQGQCAEVVGRLWAQATSKAVSWLFGASSMIV